MDRSQLNRQQSWYFILDSSTISTSFCNFSVGGFDHNPLQDAARIHSNYGLAEKPQPRPQGTQSPLFHAPSSTTSTLCCNICPSTPCSSHLSPPHVGG